MSFEESQNRARKRDAARGTNGMTVPPTEVQPTSADILERDASLAGMLVSSDTLQAKVAALLASGDYEAAPQVMSIPKGQTLVGFLEGKGPPADVMDVATKQMKAVDTWIFASGPAGGFRVSILTSAQLEKKLAPFVGGMVMITRGDDIRTSSGKNVSEYLVVGPKRADGVPRSWAQPSRQLSAGPTEHSVPEEVLRAAEQAEDLT